MPSDVTNPHAGKALGGPIIEATIRSNGRLSGLWIEVSI